MARNIKREYYMEWWEIGTDPAKIETGHFHTGHLREFLTMFMRLKKFSVVYLRRETDGKIVRDARSTLNVKA